MSVNFAPPEALQGDPARQLTQVYRYLFRLSEQLNGAIKAVENNTIEVAQSTALYAAAGTAKSTDITGTDGYNNLRSLIIKTATSAQSAIDEITTTLTSSYVAHSDFGTFQTELTNTIKNSANGTEMTFDSESELKTVYDSLAGFNTYRTETKSYIRSGIIGYNSDGTAITGIIVGQRVAEVMIDGRPQLQSDEMYSCFTANELGFYKKGIRQAYFSNQRLYVTDIEVLNTFTIGNWQISKTNGFSIKWVGSNG